ncbi:hypothetical protein [Nocardioides cynanchi]|uniref:hypothetical protein n=1 Tax=Nocardioides cynanchi TaxID=2558918 RepID=UPI001247023D|nr:hypothetical protein [Nocardioides cynanchi]
MGARGWVVTVAGAALLTGACGGGGGGGGTSFADESGPQIMSAATTDMGAVTSLHFSGDVTSGGKQIHVDLGSSTAGQCQGSFTIGRGTAQILASDGKAWMKPDHAFWEQQGAAQAAQIEKIVGDKWVSIPLSSGLSKVCDLDNLLSKLTPGNDTQTRSSTVVGTSEVGGTAAVQVRGKSKQGDIVSAWVATSSPHHVLKLAVTDGTSPGTLVFSDFDTPLAITTPAPSEVAVIPGQ